MGIPSGWKQEPLELAATLQRGFDLPVQSRRAGSVPIVASNGPVGTHDEAPVKGPGVVTGRSGTIGKVYYYEHDFWPLNTTLYVKDFHGNEPKFIAALLEYLKLERFAESTGVPSLNRNTVHPVPVLIPPLPEQRGISAILSSVDDTIKKTQAVIAQLEIVKKGLRGELLQRGMPIRHTKFKTTAIGPAPEAWNLATGEELFKLAGGYGPSSLQLDEHGECLFLKVDDLNLPENRVTIGAAALRFQAKLNPSIRVYSTGSIIFAKRGAAISKNRVRILGCSATVDPNLMVLIPGPQLNSHFIRLLLEHIGLPNLADNSGIPQLNNKHLYPHTFAIPPQHEQEEIASLISSIEQRQIAEHEYLRAIVDTKLCLTDALLSGKLRTSVHQEAA